MEISPGPPEGRYALIISAHITTMAPFLAGTLTSTDGGGGGGGRGRRTDNSTASERDERRSGERSLARSFSGTTMSLLTLAFILSVGVERARPISY